MGIILYFSYRFLKLNNEFTSIIGKDNNRKIEKSIELDVIIAESDTDLKYKEKIFAMERVQIFCIK